MGGVGGHVGGGKKGAPCQVETMCQNAGAFSHNARACNDHTMRKYGCLGQKWLRDKLSHVFSEEKNKNNKQNIKNSQRCWATTNISQESPSFFFSFFLVFTFLCGFAALF